MSNYTKENLIPIPPEAVPDGTLAIKVGNEIFTPGNIRISSGDAEYYKCASVDTTNKTWSGYKAVLKDGGYSFEEELTEGLFCDKGYTPTVGGIYSADALVGVKNLWQNVITDGLIFRASFADSITPEIGSEITSTFPETPVTVSIAEAYGKPCIYNAMAEYREGLGVLTATDSRFNFSANSTWTITCWCGGEGSDGSYYLDRTGAFWNLGNYRCRLYGKELRIGGSHPDYYVATQIQSGDWHFVAISIHPTQTDIYFDGELIGSVSNLGTGSEELRIMELEFDSVCERYMRDLRIYDRALTADEIARVRKEGE